MKYEDINNIKEIIDEEYNNLLNLKNIANPKTEFEEYEEWATRVTHYKIKDALSALHSEIISSDPQHNILRTIKEDLKKKISDDSIHTETLTRGITNYYYTVSVWQALGYSLLFKANDILKGPSANNFQYKLMISRMSKQKKVLKEIIETIDDSDNYIVRELDSAPIDCDNGCGKCGLAFSDVEFLHRGGAEADDGKVVTGFKFIRHPTWTNRLAISIKQGELKEMGVIGEQDWKDPDDNDWHTHFYNNGDEHYNKYYADWTFQKEAPGRAIVGIRLCTPTADGRKRVQLCIKTKKVHFASGELGPVDDWSEAVKNDGSHGALRWGVNGNQEWTDVGYWKLKDGEYYAEDEPVESNPPAMLTGVGLFGKEGCNTQHIAMRAKDIFEFDETDLKSCDGKHSDFFKEESDTVGCCGEYIYDSSSQACIEDEYGVEEPHYKGNSEYKCWHKY